MRAVVQRVASASVSVGDEIIAEIPRGILVLLAAELNDGDAQVKWMAGKLAGLRIFEDESGKMNLELDDVNGAVLLVSNFTVAGDVKKGKRPSFDNAAPFETGRLLFDAVTAELRALGCELRTGEYGADMKITLVNDGPVTLVLESP